MSGALKAAWALTLFVIVVGIVGWAATGRSVFAIFVILGVLTGTAAVLVFRTAPPSPSSREEHK
jgi:hypothetical protein